MMSIVNRIDAREEDIFSDLLTFLLRKNNRVLSNDEIVAKTGVSHEMLYKWVKTGKLKQSIFPNVGAPCEKCGKATARTKICVSCSTTIINTLKQEEKDREWHDKINNKHTRRNTYHYRWVGNDRDAHL